MADEQSVQRKPVQTPYMRRDHIYNPEYLDAERALNRFSPLIENLVRTLRGWYRTFETEQDTEDLRSIIQLEFLRLHQQYDPAYGVDFPGYIKLNLWQRVRYQAISASKRAGRELLAFATEDTAGNPFRTVPDERAERDMERLESVASIPMQRLSSQLYRDITHEIIDNGADARTLAARYGTTVPIMGELIEEAGICLRYLMTCDCAVGYAGGDIAVLLDVPRSCVRILAEGAGLQESAELDTLEHMACVDPDLIGNERYRDIIQEIFKNGTGIHALAWKYKLSVPVTAELIGEAGRFLRRLVDAGAEYIEIPAGDAPEDAGTCGSKGRRRTAYAPWTTPSPWMTPGIAAVQIRWILR